MHDHRKLILEPNRLAMMSAIGPASGGKKRLSDLIAELGIEHNLARYHIIHLKAAGLIDSERILVRHWTELLLWLTPEGRAALDALRRDLNAALAEGVVAA